ncbi:MAG: NUDIX hydrolase [Traorella sp.]
MKIGLGVGILLIRNNQVLLGLRNSKKEVDKNEINGQGTWSMPGGKVNFQEKLIDAASRELKEETNLIANDLKLITVSDDITETAHYVTVGFICNNYEGQLKTMESNTISNWTWFDLDALPSNLYEPSQRIIEKYKSAKIY